MRKIFKKVEQLETKEPVLCMKTFKQREVLIVSPLWHVSHDTAPITG